MSSALERRVERLERASGAGCSRVFRCFVDGVAADGETWERWERETPEDVKRRARVICIVTEKTAVAGDDEVLGVVAYDDEAL